MAFHAAPAVCSTAAYQPFLPLAGFPPALGWCSTVSLLPPRTNGADALVPRGIQCPVGSELCAVLAQLQAADRDFARGVCCCVGVCVGPEPTATVTVPGVITTTSDTPEETFSVSWIQRHSSRSLETVASSASVPRIQRHSSRSLETVASSASIPWIQRHSSGSLHPGPSSVADWTVIMRHTSDSLDDPMPSTSTTSTSVGSVAGSPFSTPSPTR